VKPAEQVQEAKEVKSSLSGLTPKQEEFVLGVLKDDISSAQEYIRPVRTERTENYKAYRGKAYGNEQPGRSAFVSSDIMDTVEWILPALLKIFYSGSRVVSAVGRKTGDDEGAACMEELVDWQIQVQNDGFLEFYSWIKDALIYPNAYVETGWEKIAVPMSKDRVEIAEFQELLQSPEYEVHGFEPVIEVKTIPAAPDNMGRMLPAETYEEIKYFKDVKYCLITRNTNVFECFHPAEFLIEKGATSIPDSNFSARLYKRPFHWLKSREKTKDRPSGIYINLSQLEDKLTKEPSPSDIQYEKRANVIETGLTEIVDDQVTNSVKSRTQVNVYRCWCRLDLEGKEQGKLYLAEIANDVLIRFEPLVFKHGEIPIIDLKANIDTHQHFGIAIATELQQLQKLKTALTRQLIDNVAFQNNGFNIVQRDSNTDLNALINPKPRGVVMTDDAKGIERVTPSYMGEAALGVLRYFDEIKENKTGVTKYNQGTDSEALNKTARGISQIMAASQQRIETIARIFAETGMKRLMKHFIENNRQFMTKRQEIRLLDKTIEFDPKNMVFQYDLIVNTGIGTGNKQQKIQDLQMIQQMLLGDPTLSGMGMVTPQERYNMYEDLLMELGRKNVARYVRKPPEQAAISDMTGDMTTEEQGSVPSVPMPGPGMPGGEA
jgi:hypothetical protein